MLTYCVAIHSLFHTEQAGFGYKSPHLQEVIQYFSERKKTENGWSKKLCALRLQVQEYGSIETTHGKQA